MAEPLRIIFMGTPDFAVPSLRILCENGYSVVAVVTSPDRPSGRGLTIQPSPVKQYANSRHIPVLQPEKLRSEAFLKELKGFHADLQVVVAFRMLPEIVWNMPRLGTLNLHASLLPDYRGAAPINHAIMQGETITGLTTFLLQHAIDTGDILLQQEIPISPDDTAGSLHDRMMEKGAALVLKTVQMLESGQIEPSPQQGESTKKAPKIFKEDCQINWQQNAAAIRNFVRGLSPYPAAWTMLHDKQLKVFSCHIESATNTPEPGFIEIADKKYIRIAAQDGWVYLDDLQWQGKRRMSATAFLNGLRT